MTVRERNWANSQTVGNPIGKWILVILADHADEDGYCWPRQDTIAKRAEVSRETVSRHLKMLEEKGFIRKAQRGRQSDKNRLAYYLNFECDAGSHLAHQSVTEDHTNCDGGSHSNVTEDHIPYKEEPSVPTFKEPTPHNPPTDLFERFWKAYPSRSPHDNPKKPARKKFEAAVKAGADPEQIIAAATYYAQRMSEEDRKFVAQAQTWLSQERYLDQSDLPDPAATRENIEQRMREFVVKCVERGQDIRPMARQHDTAVKMHKAGELSKFSEAQLGKAGII